MRVITSSFQVSPAPSETAPTSRRVSPEPTLPRSIPLPPSSAILPQPMPWPLPPCGSHMARIPGYPYSMVVLDLGATNDGNLMNVLEQECAEAAIEVRDASTLAAVLERSRELDFPILFAKAFAVAGDASEVVALLLPHMTAQDRESVCNEPILCHAVLGNQPLSLLDTLGQLGLDFNAPHVMGWSPLHYAAQWPASRQGSAIVQLAARYGSHPATFGVSGTPLHILFSVTSEIGDSERLAMTRALILYGTPLDAVNCRGQTALHMAIENATFWCAILSDILQLFIKHGAPLNARDQNGKTPLAKVLALCGLREVQLLVASGADCGIELNDGTSMLEWAATYQDEEVVEFLVKSYAFSRDAFTRAVQTAQLREQETMVIILRSLSPKEED